MTLPLDRLTIMIQSFNQEMSLIVKEFGGFVLKYVRDAVLEFFCDFWTSISRESGMSSCNKLREMPSGGPWRNKDSKKRSLVSQELIEMNLTVHTWLIGTNRLHCSKKEIQWSTSSFQNHNFQQPIHQEFSKFVLDSCFDGNNSCSFAFSCDYAVDNKFLI